MSRQRKLSVDRRTALQAIAGMTATVGAGVAGASESSHDAEIPEAVKEQIRERYPEEADHILRILSRNLGRIDQGNATPDEAHRQARKELVEHPKTPEVSEDIRETMAMIERSKSAQSRGASPSTAVDTLSVQSTYSLDPFYGEEDGSSTLTGESDRSYDVFDDVIRSNARIALSGTATGYARLYSTVTPGADLSGYVRIDAPYYRLGRTQDAETKISLFVRTAGGDIVKRTLETPNNADGEVTKSEQFYLQEGVEHDIGIELYTTVGGIRAYGYSDYYNSSTAGTRRVELTGPLEVHSLD